MVIGRRVTGSGLQRRSRGAAAAATQGPPTLASIDVSSGSEVGGDTRTVTGTNLAGATSVLVGGVAATGVSSTATTCTFTTPAINASTTFVGRATHALSSTAADNTMDVVVTTPYGSATLAGGYSYTSEAKRALGSKFCKEHRASDPRIGLNGSAVSALPCFNGNGSADQGTAANQPAYSATGYRSGPAITGDGSNDKLAATLGTSIATTKRPHMWIVLKWVATANDAYFAALADAGATCRLSARLDGSKRWVIDRGDSSGATTPVGNGGVADTSKHRYRCGLTAGGTACVKIDGSGFDDATRTGTVNAAITRFSLFDSIGGGSNSNITILHVIVSDDAPTAGENTAIEAFLDGAYHPAYTAASYG